MTNEKDLLTVLMNLYAKQEHIKIKFKIIKKEGKNE